MTYYGDLQRSLDLLFYTNGSRDQLSSGDEDVLQIFSGDEKAARNGVMAFADRHKDACWTVSEASPHIVIKVSGLFPDPEQKVLKDKYLGGKHRFRERQKFPQGRPERRNPK